jgi:adenylate cyclase
MRAELRELLRNQGASDEDIDRAEQDGWVPLLALDRVLVPGAPRYDLASFARASGLDEHLLHRLWRALGFPDVPETAVVFTDGDLHAARRLLERAEVDHLDQSTLIRQVQVVSAAMARVASVEADAITDQLNRLRAAGLSDDEVATALLDAVRWQDLAELVDYEHRVQLRAAIWRRLALEASPDTAVGVGFADLAGYTKATAHLDSDEISELIARWEERAYDIVTEHGGRVVKTIGDEVMFVGLARAAVDAALALCDAGATEAGLLPVRAAVAAGPVVQRNGDFYGPVVNLASRLSEIARSGEVLAPGDLRNQLDDDDLRWEPRGARRLRSIGETEVFRIGRPG